MVWENIIIIGVGEPTGLAKASEDVILTQSNENKLDTQRGNHMRAELEKAVYTAPLDVETVWNKPPHRQVEALTLMKISGWAWTPSRAVKLHGVAEAEPSSWGWAGDPEEWCQGAERWDSFTWWAWGFCIHFKVPHYPKDTDGMLGETQLHD